MAEVRILLFYLWNLERLYGRLIVQLKPPPVDGKTNAELIKRLAKYFQVPRTAIGIKSGQFSRLKWVEID